MSHFPSFLPFLALGLFAGAVQSQCTTVLGASKDNTLYESTLGSLSNGAGQFLFAGRTNLSGLVHRGLIAFDVAGAIPSGSTILSVQLELSMSRSISGSEPVTLHRVSADWGEGSSAAPGNEGGGAPAAPGDATWVHRFFSTSAWAASGGDFLAAPSASLSVDLPGNYSVSSSQMAADVQGWLDNPGTAFGWLIMGNELSGGSSKRFDTRDNVSPVARPRLRVVFTTTRAAAIPVGSGCGGSNPLPFTLSASGRPSLGNNAFALGGARGPAGQLSLAIYTLGLLPAPLGISPTCTLWVDPLAILLVNVAFLDGNGSGSFPTPIPNDASLTGGCLAAQGIALDNAGPGGLVLSNAMTLVLGN